MSLPVPGIEPTSSEFLDKCVTHYATVADAIRLIIEDRYGGWLKFIAL